MKIINLRVDWMHKWSNDPSIYVQVDKIPPLENLLYEKRGCLYYAELEGYVSFFSYTMPGEGYGGREFSIKMTDGTDVVLHGPWSSNSYAINEASFGPCSEVAITDEDKVWKVGHTFWSASLTVAVLNEALERLLPSVYMASIGDHYFIPHSKVGCAKTEGQTSLYTCPVCNPSYNHWARATKQFKQTAKEMAGEQMNVINII